MKTRYINNYCRTSSRLITDGVILLLIITCLADITSAVERIPDWKLTELYGGHVIYNNPYCASGGNNCEDVGCVAPAMNCCVCPHYGGETCHDNYGSTQDKDGCRNYSQYCPSGCIRGFCDHVAICDPGIVLDPPFPNCNQDYRIQCLD